MGEVVVSFKVMPTGTDIDLDKLESRLKEAVKRSSVKREPVAFGLFALRVTSIMPDAGGELDKAEAALRAVEGVAEVEVEEVARTL